MKETNPIVSVIVPIYNREKYVARCIKSICNQNYKELEIILVNDGSTDNSGRICKRFAAMDSRIIYIEKENEGSGFARNTGMDVAKGEYLFFVDSDDFIHERCIKELMTITKKKSADIVKCGYERGNKDYFRRTYSKKRIKEYTNIQAFRTREMNIAVWGKLYRQDIIKNIRYPKETLYDDEFFTYRCIYAAQCIIIFEQQLYYNFMSPVSIMRKERSELPVDIITKAYKERISFFYKVSEQELIGISHKELAIRLMLLYIQANNYENGLEMRESILKAYKKHYRIGRKYAFGWKEKLSLNIFYCSPFQTVKIVDALSSIL